MCLRMKFLQQQRSYIHYWASIKAVPDGVAILKIFFWEQMALGEYSIYHLCGSNKHMRWLVLVCKFLFTSWFNWDCATTPWSRHRFQTNECTGMARSHHWIKLSAEQNPSCHTSDTSQVRLGDLRQAEAMCQDPAWRCPSPMDLHFQRSVCHRKPHHASTLGQQY